ncbi:FMN-dependent NADH-azoreductase, partial [Streptococcus agalactiae]|nr:FMN-dependent NADH-azoreductase [Streptococcus agalactiae]
GETFKYTENGSVGLMTDDYRLLMLESAGSIYSKGQYSPDEFPVHYLKAIFKDFMAFDDFCVVRAEGTDILDRQVVLDKMNQDLREAFEAFYSKE